MEPNKFIVEIWSDVTCVHCYIAKRKFESALTEFEHANNIEIVWKSFELAPNLKVEQGKSMYQFLADYNGASVEQVKAICTQIEANAKEVGLMYNFEIAVPANSFLSHRFSHLTKHYGVQDKAKEAVFKAHFIEGKNIDDIDTIVQLGVELGLEQETVRKELTSDAYTANVKQDIEEANSRQIKGVPYYLFNAKHAIYGVKNTDFYLDTLRKAYREWQEATNNSNIENSKGESCEIGGIC